MFSFPRTKDAWQFIKTRHELFTASKIGIGYNQPQNISEKTNGRTTKKANWAL